MDFDFLFLNTVSYVKSSPTDLVALGWFLFCWLGYTYIVDNWVSSSRGLGARMYLYRIQWMTNVLTRENRVVDVNIVSSLHQSISFFASTSILIIAGILAIVGASDAALDVIRELPFASQPTLSIWYTKLGLMVILFVYAYFKYTWALRQLNYATILIGAMPDAKDNMDDYIPAARRAAMVLTMAAKHMNRGLRTYYFALGAIAWLINPWFFIIATSAVVWIIYSREFRSDIVTVLNMPSEEKILLSEDTLQSDIKAEKAEAKELAAEADDAQGDESDIEKEQ